MPDFLTFLFFRTHIEIKSSIISKYQQIESVNDIKAENNIYFYNKRKCNYHWYNFTLSSSAIMKNRNPFRTIKPKKVQFVLYLHTVAIELINRMKTNEIGEIVWKKVPNVSYSSIIRILANFILEPPVSLNHKVLLQAIPITFSKSLHKSSTCNHEPQFPVLKRIINLIFKVWGIKRSGKSLYQILYLW